jgi:hypothetical protein
MVRFYLANVTDIPSFLKWANVLSGGIFAPMVILIFYIIIFSVAALNRQGTDKSFIAANVATSILIFLFVGMEILEANYIIIGIILFGISGFLAWRKR